ncbi:MAG: hypothetical protein Q9191_003136, partial [Dirinaria sp. TL-2023a]
MQAHKIERALTDPTTASEPMPRRGVQLPPLQTDFPARPPSQRHPRPRPTQTVALDQIHQPTPPLETGALGRKPSRGIMMGLFGRNKSYRSAKPKAVLATQEEGDRKETLDRLHIMDEKRELKAEEAPLAYDINIVPSVPQAASSPIKNRPSKARRNKSFRKVSAAWDPPPLFQAYPQAIKHACLTAPFISADAILRHAMSQSSSRSDQNYSAAEDSWHADKEIQRRQSKNSKKRHRMEHDVIAESGWTTKIYVLVTSGYLLQYSGEGSFDRLPEKILPLGKDSAAFASDVIQGKPWVLQIAQEVSDYDGSFQTQGPSSVFKKMGVFQEARKTAANFLLVIDCPDEMNAWLVAVRKEIEALGGKKYVPDVAMREDSGEVARKLQHFPSQRYLVKKRQLIEEAQRPLPAGESMAAVSEPIQKNSWKFDPGLDRKSVDALSVSNTTASADPDALDKLRETPRMSYISDGSRTIPTSRGSSPAQSPAPAFCLVDFEDEYNGSLPEGSGMSKGEQASIHLLSPAVTARRESQDGDLTQAKILPRTNTSDGQSSSSAPNFSVPSFSKRYSTSMTRTATPPSGRTSTSLPQTVIEETKPINGPSNGPSISPRTSPKASKSLGNLSAHCSPPPAPSFSFATKSRPGELISSLQSETALPRRFSSLDYSKGISPVSYPSQFPASPHPPPTSALPDLPGLTSMSTKLKSTSSRHSMQPLLNPSQEGNARRPISMQVRSSANQVSTFQIASKQSN